MISPFTKPRVLSRSSLEAAAEFHGHLEPFLLLGLRMGQLALRLLDAKGYFDLRCVVEVHWAPPDSCLIDGIQFSTGCTMGKHNIEVTEWEGGVATTFTKGKKSLRIELKPSVLKSVYRSFEEDTAEILIEELLSTSEEEIFNIK